MERSSDALNSFEKELGMIDPDQKISTLTARLVALNTDLTSAQDERIRKEAAYNSVKGGSLDAAYASEKGDQLRIAKAELDKAKAQFALAQAQWGSNHPEYQKAESRLQECKASSIRSE